jgi:phosphohistidine swiveling domain-containing protein
VGAGRPVAIDPGVEAMPPPRRVLVVPAAVPQLAPFLWEAAGLVAGSGSEGAHLFEVARSLGVPAVIGVELDPSADGVVAVDGDAGTVSELSLGTGGGRSNPRFSLERRTG